MSKIINKGKHFRISSWSNKSVIIRPDTLTEKGELPIKVDFKTRNGHGQFVLFVDSSTVRAMRTVLDIHEEAPHDG